MRKNGLKKKAALTLAVLGALSPVTGVNSLLTDFGTVTIVEAATNSSVGEVSAFAKDSNPKGYLLCDGRAVSRTEYAELFAEIGTKYGAGDGKTTFNLPKLTDGRFIEGSTTAGTYHEAGLPNITGYADGLSIDTNFPSGGALYFDEPNGVGTGSSDGGNGRTYFDASRSNPIYGKSTTVQPNALTMRYYIKATKTADGGDGKIQAGNKETISGDTAYNELRPTDGNYVKKNNTTASNLKALDTQAKANANNIVKAESNAKAYSDQKLAEAENRAKADATNKANAAEAAAKADATNKANAAQTNAINTATQKVADAEARAKADATNKANAAQSAAAQDATNKANAAQSAAAQDATKKANAAETNAKSYTDIVTEAAKTYAKTYTDEVAKGKANISMNNINEAGKQVIRDLAKDEIKNSGIDTTGDTIIINKPLETRDIYVNGEIKTTGDIEAGGDIHGKGDLEIDGDTHLHGNTEIDKNLTVHGNTVLDGTLTVKDDATFEKNVHIKGNQEVDGDSVIHGNQTVDGDSHIKGNETIDKNLHVKGDTTVDGKLHVGDNAEFDKDVVIHGSETIDQNLHVKGDSEVDGDSSIHGDLKVDGNTTLGDDKSKDVLDVNAKTNLHGDTVIGDDASDKLTVNATSEFTADATFDKNAHVKGDLQVDQDLIIKGSTATTGDARVIGSQTVDKDLHVKGDGKFGKDLYVEGMTDTGALVSRGDAVIGGDAHIYGDIVLDGKFFAKAAAQFGDNVDIAKNLTVGGDSHVYGDSVVDGDIYGRSFNVGNERYIDKDGINANGHKIRNVADGEISPNSTDAVNGRQLFNVREDLTNRMSNMNSKLTGNVNEVGAGAAAMASLHPLEYKHNDKVSVSAAVGAYKNATALAAGVFYRPSPKTMINVSTSLGYNDNMVGVGYSQRLGEASEIEGMTEEQLRDKVDELNESNKALIERLSQNEAHDKAMEQENNALKAQNAAFEKQLAEMTAKMDALSAKLASMEAPIK